VIPFLNSLILRKANSKDVPSIVSLLLEDDLGQLRECAQVSPGDSYYQAFSAIDNDPNQELLIVQKDNEIIGTLQLSFIPNMTFKGSWRCQIEGVRIKESFRGQGIGRWLFERVFDKAKLRGCALVQLTTNKARPEAHKFYESLGFVASHTGLKKVLS
jgi:GNAT superfamily N-acetyltransferase